MMVLLDRVQDLLRSTRPRWPHSKLHQLKVARLVAFQSSAIASEN
jgi:hypothetical protein